MTSKLLSTAEAAEKLGLAQETISRLIRKGKLDGQKVGSYYVVTLESVEEYATATAGKSKNDPTRRAENDT